MSEDATVERYGRQSTTSLGDGDPEGTKSVPVGLRSRQPRPNECGDDYPVVAMLDPKTRVVECTAGIQWIIQKRVVAAGRYPWRSKYFCRTKEGLLLYARPITPELLALPEYFERRSKDDWLDWPPYEGAP